MNSLQLAIGIAVGTLLLGGVIGLLIGRRLAGAARTSGELQLLRDERDRIAAELQTARSEATDALSSSGRLEGLLEAARKSESERVLQVQGLETNVVELREAREQETIAARTAAASLRESRETIDGLRKQVGTLETRLNESLAATVRVEKDCVQLQANSTHMQRANEETKAFVDGARERLSAAFAELAGKAFEEKGQLFETNVKNAAAQSRADIDLMLKPFAERLKDFRDRVDVIYENEARERQTLTGAVTELKGLNQEMATQAAALTRALKGSAKVRGDWGELMLETVLRCSGLEEGVHFDRQQARSDDEGGLLRPDIVIRLPNDRRVVVDSKVNLMAWIDAMNADSPEVYDAALKRHTIAFRQHVKELAERNYPKALGAGTLETTIAFVPIEGAMSAALGSDGALQAYAFEQRIVFASPNTLMALLRVVDQLWTREKIQRQAMEIGDAGGKVLDAVSRFLQEFEKIGNKLSSAHESFNDARKFLSESSQSVLPRVRRLAELGVKGRKALHADLHPDVIGGIDATESGQEQLTDASEETAILPDSK